MLENIKYEQQERNAQKRNQIMTKRKNRAI